MKQNLENGLTQHMNTTTPQLIETPANITGGMQYQHLAYLDAYDAVLNCDYAFVAYKETDSWGWRVRIKSSQTAGAVFEPDAMKSNARSTSAQGKSWFQWGYSFDPSASDPRCIQFHVHVVNGQPSEIEIFVQLRKFDGAADAPKSVKFPLAGVTPAQNSEVQTWKDETTHPTLR